MVYYRHDGFVFRCPAPATLANIQKLEVWTEELGWRPVEDAATRAEATWYGAELSGPPPGVDGPARRDASERYDMPTIADVSAPSLLKGVSIQFQPTKKKRKYGKRPKRFEASLMSLRDIPETLDRHLEALRGALAQAPADDDHVRYALSHAILRTSTYGAGEVGKEFMRQGVVTSQVTPETDALIESACDDWARELEAIVQDSVRACERRHLTDATKRKWLPEMVARKLPSVVTRFSNRVTNEAFALGRAQQTQGTLKRIDLARKRADTEYPIDLSEITVVQTAVLDKNLCEECEAVHGETMDYGSDRQQDLATPYVKCLGHLGGNTCRCQQLAIIGKEAIDVSEVSDEELEDLLQESDK